MKDCHTSLKIIKNNLKTLHLLTRWQTLIWKFNWDNVTNESNETKFQFSLEEKMCSTIMVEHIVVCDFFVILFQFNIFRWMSGQQFMTWNSVWVMQQDNEPKTEWWGKKSPYFGIVKSKPWPDLNPTEMLRADLTRAVKTS